jgi:tRNA dimethylallyltransferase
MEIFRATGQQLSILQKAKPEGAIEGTHVTLLIAPPRDILYARINARFPLMLEAGGVAEAETFLARALDPSLPLMKAVGLAPVADMLKGVLTRQEAIDLATRDTRRFAKRQLTWFRHQLKAAAVWDGHGFAQYSKRFFEENLSKIIN